MAHSHALVRAWLLFLSRLPLLSSFYRQYHLSLTLEGVLSSSRSVLVSVVFPPSLFSVHIRTVFTVLYSCFLTLQDEHIFIL